MTRCPSTLPVAPERKRSAWPMWLAPATMACTRVKTLRPGRKPPARSVKRTMVSTSASRPRRDANVATTISPASATSPGSSKVTCVRSRPRDTGFTESASWQLDDWDFRHHNCRRSGGLSRGWAAYNPVTGRCSQAKAPLAPSQIDTGGVRAAPFAHPFLLGHLPANLAERGQDIIDGAHRGDRIRVIDGVTKTARSRSTGSV